MAARRGARPWDWIVDETRSLTEWEYADPVAELPRALDRPGPDRLLGRRGAAALLCESRTFGGVLRRALAAEYLCPVAATNGQVGGFLHTNVAPDPRATSAASSTLATSTWPGAQIEETPAACWYARRASASGAASR